MNGHLPDDELDLAILPAELEAAEALDQYLSAVASGASPVLPTNLTPTEEQAYALGGALQERSAPDGAVTPTADFAARLRASLLSEMPVALPPARRTSRGPSRRSLLAGGLGAAAGMAAGVGAALALTHTPSTQVHNDAPLVGLAGAWVVVAQLDELLPGMVKRFATDQVVGYLVRHADGSFLALSAACTHMGCIVAWNAADRTFDCPCHAGRFDAAGQFYAGPFRYTPLPQLETKVQGAQILVYVPTVPTSNQGTATPPARATPGGGDGEYKP